MNGIAAGLTCLGLACLAVLFIPGRPEAPPHPAARWAAVVLALLFFLIAAGMFFGLIKV